MNNLITKSDFKNPYMIFAGEPATESLLNDLIEFYQPIYLRKILGEAEYQHMITDSNPDGTFDTAKWTNFVNGTTYTANGETYVYEGIKPVLCMFIFYHWNCEAITRLSELGAVKAQYQKLMPVVPNAKMAFIYNEAVHRVYNQEYLYPSVYNYLLDADTFSDWVFSGIAKINMFL